MVTINPLPTATFSLEETISLGQAILIGPEGGFTDFERKWLVSKNFVQNVSLGPRILRADTAVVAALTLWQSSIGDW